MLKLPVKSMINTWTKQAGYPLLSLDENGIISQERFFHVGLCHFNTYITLTTGIAYYAKICTLSTLYKLNLCDSLQINLYLKV